ncbi:stage II sporulation protein P [Paenibacillus physcomitrellae]|uniref:Stage II sporulation protein P n=1 Tax=Paenibacillus physcomitrellae TaxID=1619311 RepID=A0ABQ1FKM2_9BACL|nr:stage II sporulation protein P [Paenibacillus physcomitrellae]GGA20284.1 stage II sporulation protein P [Paenibacillus physcomitrellae]
MNGFKTWNVGQFKRRTIQILAMGRTMVVLTLLSFVFFVLLGIGGLAEKRINSSPVSSMKGLAASMPGSFFAEMLGMEVPHLKDKEPVENEVLSGENMTNFVFQLLTNVNPSDPKSLVAREVPGLAAGNPILLRAGSGTAAPTAPEDYRTGDTEDHPDSGVTGDSDKPDTDSDQSPDQNGSPSTSSKDQTDSGGSPTKDSSDQQPSGAQTGTSKPDNTGSSKGTDGKDGASNGASSSSAKERKTVMIYHSHPYESYNPLLSKQTDNPSSSDPAKNVGVVGDFVAQELEKKGVGAYHAFEDYMKNVQGYNYNYSYKYSRVTVKETLAEYADLNYFIDIHRDSQRYSKTTTTINGVSYAQLYFIIGHGNPDWKKNEAFANKIYERIEKEYPGLSRGIWGKTSAQGNGEYNQSLSPNSVLIEVGGIDNTKEELQRTSKILADTLADVYFEDQKAEKVGGTASSSNKTKTTKP